MGNYVGTFIQKNLNTNIVLINTLIDNTHNTHQHYSLSNYVGKTCEIYIFFKFKKEILFFEGCVISDNHNVVVD